MAALQALDSADLTVTGSNGGPYTITFQGAYAGLNLSPLFGDAINLTNSNVIQTIATAYDANDQVTSTSDASSSYAFTYDNLGRATGQTADLTGLTPQISFTNVFDAGSRQTSQAVSIGSTADLKNEWTYDNLSRLTRVTQQGQSGGNTVQAKRADFTYNAVGQKTGIDRFQNTAGTNSVAQTAFTYNSIGLLTDIDHTQGSTVLASYDLAYDAMSRLTSRSHSVDGTSTFTYDTTSQLTAADNPGSITDESYSYNANGSRNSTGYTTGTNNLTSSDGTYNYTYDAEGNRSRRTKISDGSYADYTWDHRNRLTKITEKTSGGTVTKVVEQSYDAMDRWVRRSTDPDGAGSAGYRDTFFVYAGSSINTLLQFDGTSVSSLSHRYLWSDAVDQILADEQVTSLSTAGNTLWGLGDNLGSVRDIADQNESTYATTVTNHRVYDGFGKLTSETNSSVDLLFGFTGKLLDEDSELQNNLNRWYDAALGQWLSEDPARFIASDTNLRRYVSNSPQNASDPLGLAEESANASIPQLPSKLIAKLDLTALDEDNQAMMLEIFARMFHAGEASLQRKLLLETLEPGLRIEPGEYPLAIPRDEKNPFNTDREAAIRNTIVILPRTPGGSNVLGADARIIRNINNPKMLPGITEIKLPPPDMKYLANANISEEMLWKLRISVISHEMGHLAPTLMLSDPLMNRTALLRANGNIDKAKLNDFLNIYNKSKNGASVQFENMINRELGLPLRETFMGSLIGAGVYDPEELKRLNTFKKL